MSCWLVFFVLICVYKINCQSSGWMGSLSTTSYIGIFKPPSNEYIITKFCGKAGQIVDAIGNLMWTNGINSYSNSDYFGGHGGGEWCLETSCIHTIRVEYDVYADVEDTVGKLTVTGFNNQQIWGQFSSVNTSTFSCDPGHCISTLKVKKETNTFATFVTGINVDCNKPTISPTGNTYKPTNIPSYIPTIIPTITPTVNPTNSPTILENISEGINLSSYLIWTLVGALLICFCICTITILCYCVYFKVIKKQIIASISKSISANNMDTEHNNDDKRNSIPNNLDGELSLETNVNSVHLSNHEGSIPKKTNITNFTHINQINVDTKYVP